MKKLILVALFALISLGAYAQQGTVGAGIQLDLASRNNLVGLGGHLSYNVTNPIRLQLSGDYYFEHHGMDMGDLNFDVHYLFGINNVVSVYPLAGLTLEFFDHDTKFGGNIGGGIEFKVSPSVSVGAELKGQLVEDFSRFNTAFRLTYRF